MKKRYAAFLFIVLCLFLIGCSRAKEKEADGSRTVTAAPVYGRTMAPFKLDNDANPYMTEFTQDGFYYFVMGEDAYQFFYQSYDGSGATPFCTVSEGIVKGFSGTASGGQSRLSILTVGEEGAILTWEGAGSSFKKITLEQSFNTPEERMVFIALPEGGFVIGREESAYFLDEDGRTICTLKAEGTIRRFLFGGGQGDGEDGENRDIYAVVEQNESGRTESFLVKLDASKGRAETVRALPENTMDVLAFEDGFVMISANLVTFFRLGGEDDEPLIDLGRQSLFGSQLRYFFGDHEEIKVVSFVQEDYEGRLITLSESLLATGADQAGEAAAPAEETEELPLYAPDGRRIVRVAVPESCIFQIEFHAKKYNQTSETAFIEVIRYEDSLESFLGKGNRPDIIVFQDATEVPAYVQKNVLVNLAPMFSGEEVCAPANILSRVREILDPEDTGTLYAMPGFFRMLMRTSDGTEYDADGRCDTVSYLQWYDRFLTEESFNGVGKLEELLYGNIAFFYDEEQAEAYFASDAFKELMQAYKEVYDRHSGALERNAFVEEDIQAYAEKEIGKGPSWHGSYRCWQMEAPNIKMEGIPGMDGEDHVYIRLLYPMGLMSTSDCKEEAFDFIVYYNSLTNLLLKGESEGNYGKGETAEAVFSAYAEHMREHIYESERPYYTGFGEERFFSEEQLSQLDALLDRAVPESAVQREIYVMLTEEMDAYLNGSKSLDAACDVLQNRVTLYLQERN